MAAAIWSCPTQAMLGYPLTTFVRFARNHGLLQIFDRPQWQTVRGGGREYVERIVATLADVRLATPVKSVLRDADGVWLGLPGGECERFDEVVLACHSDQALALLGSRGHPGRAAHPRRHPLPAQPRRAAYRPPPAAARRARLVGVELHGRARGEATAATAGQRLLPDQPGCSRCRRKRR
jgi:hypothetical protein